MKGLYSLVEFQGRRDGMEDRSAVVIGEDFMLFGVFDGHGGESCSQFCKDKMLQAISSHLLEGAGPKLALEKGFAKVDSEYCNLASKLDLDDGSTATVLLLRGTEYFLASTGDSRAVMVDCNGDSIPLSYDHKPDRRDERKRVIKAGGQIAYDDDNGTYRVLNEEVGGLAVTRAIGDYNFKPYVTGEPEVSSGILSNSISYICMASDGLWDDVSNEEAGKVLLEQSKNIQKSTEHLVEIAYSRGSEDNITVVTVDIGKYLGTLKVENKPKKSSEERKSDRKLKKKEKRVIPGLSEDGYLSNVLLWKTPVTTFLWLSVGILVFFLTYFADFSVLSLTAYLLLMQIVITFLVVKLAPILIRIKLLSSGFDSTVFVFEGSVLSDEVVERAANVTEKLATTVFEHWTMIVREGTPTRILIALRFISYFFSPLPLQVVLFALFVALFSLPATYHHNQTFLDKHYQKATASYQRLQRKIFKK